jgi:alpha,alpha-trehalase
MAIKEVTSRELRLKGECKSKKSGDVPRISSLELCRLTFSDSLIHRFGWVNASYVYGLQIVNAHMKRALGAVTSWETFQKMTDSASLTDEHSLAAAHLANSSIPSTTASHFNIGPVPHHHPGPEERHSRPHSHSDTYAHPHLDAHK